MKVLTLSWVFLPLLFNISVQQCTIGQFHTTITTMVMSTEVTSDGQINSTYYNCLSRSDTRDHYSSMSVSILYIRSDDPNNVHEIRYNLQCNNNVWEIVGNQSTALRSNTSYDCSDCTDQTVNDYHCTNVKHSNINVISSFESVTLLEGDTVTLSCTPSIRETVLWWTHNGSVIETNSVAMLTPSTSDQNFIITNAEINDSGIYTCRDAMDNPVLQQNITVIVLPGCEKDFSGGVFWETSRLNSTVTQPCSRLHPRFRFGVNIKRQCYNNGSWSSIDLSDCTMYRNSFPVVIVYFTITSNNVTVNPDDIIDDVVHQVSSIVTEVPEFVNRTWNFTSSGVELLSISLLFTLKTRSVPLAVVENLRNVFGNIIFSDGVLLKSGSSIEVLAFQPNSSCSCNVTDDDDIRTVCTGPSTPPCLCRSPESCICNSPTYVGDGNVCGLDSDSDGFPDVGLDCDLPQCKRDLCVEIYSKTEDGQSDLFCKEIEDTAFMGCQREIDGQWKITWPPTNVSEVAIQKCPGGSEAVGLARRKCLEDGMWDIPDVAECHNVEQIRLERRANELNSIVEGQKGDERDMTQTFRPEVVEDIAEGLEDITTTEQPLLPNDIDSTANTIDIIISSVEFTQLQNVEVDSSFVMNVIEDATNVLDSLLDERNDESFEQMTNRNESDASPSIGERMLSNIERIGTLLSSTLDSNSNETVKGTLAGNNTVIEAQIPIEQDLMAKKDIDFPTDDSSSVSPFTNFGNRVPRYELSTSVILEQMKSKGARIPIITSVARSSRLSANKGERIDSVIISIQISDDPQTRTDLGDEPVTLIFDIGMAENTTRFRPRCAFFDFSNLSNQSGRFSVDGIAVITRNSTYVQCTSNHLTSFAVLVDVSGGGSESQALSIVSYIGCAVSIVCLIVAVVAFIALRRKVFNLIQHFVHLNLSIALLLGLITFVSGIEAASEYGASCLIVAILLHYFFMAAFSWMLCEGVLLFIMLKFVFYRGFFKRRLFFLILGWGLPVPIVIISAAVSHEQYGVNDRCWISEEKGAIWAFVGPMLLIIMANFFFLIVTMHEVFKTNRGKSSTEKINALNTVKSLLRTAVIIVPLLGCTWVFGLLAINEGTAVFAWIFTILNSLQGVSILFLYVLKNEKFLRTVKVCGQKYYSSDAGTQSSSVKMFTLQKNKKASDITLKSKTSTIRDSIVCNDDSFQINCSSPLTPISVFNNDSVVEKFSFQPELTPCTLQEESNEEQVATSQSQDEIHHHEESTVYTNEDAVEETYL